MFVYCVRCSACSTMYSSVWKNAREEAVSLAHGAATPTSCLSSQLFSMFRLPRLSAFFHRDCKQAANAAAI